MIFKNEGDQEGEPFGPLFLLADDAPNQWPVGSLPGGVLNLGWTKRSVARAEAARRGVVLEEI